MFWSDFTGGIPIHIDWILVNVRPPIMPGGFRASDYVTLACYDKHDKQWRLQCGGHLPSEHAITHYAIIPRFIRVIVSCSVCGNRVRKDTSYYGGDDHYGNPTYVCENCATDMREE